MIGVLFIAATVCSLAAAAAQGSILDDREYLVGLAAHDGRLIGSALLFILAAMSAMGTAILLFPILRPWSEGVAIGYLVMRVFENLLYVGGAVATLALLTVSKADVSIGGASDSALAGASLLALQHWSVEIGTLIFFGAGAWILNQLLYRSEVVPRWLSVWGLAGAALVLIYGLIGIVGGDTDMGSTLMAPAMPIAVQEMVFAGWLIVRGLDDQPRPVEDALPAALAG